MKRRRFSLPWLLAMAMVLPLIIAIYAGVFTPALEAMARISLAKRLLGGWLMIGAVVVGWILYRGLRLGRASVAWTETPGLIVGSKVVRSTMGEGSDTYSPRIKFRYCVAGVTFESDEWTHHARDGSEASAREIVDRYSAGREVIAYYDPANPSRAVLQRGVRVRPYVIGFIGAGILFVAGVLLGLNVI